MAEKEIDVYSEILLSNNIRSSGAEYEQSWDGKSSKINMPTSIFEDIANVASDVADTAGNIGVGFAKGLPKGASKAGMEIMDTITGQWWSQTASPWLDENIPGLASFNKSVNEVLAYDGTAQEISGIVGEVGTQIIAPGAMVTKSLQGLNLGSRFLTNVLGYGSTEALVIPAKDKGLIESAMMFLAKDSEATKAVLETLEADQDLPYLLQKLQRTPVLMFEGGVIGESISEGLGLLIKYGKNSPMLKSLKSGIKSNFQRIGINAKETLENQQGTVNLSSMGAGEIDTFITTQIAKFAPDYKKEINKIALARNPNVKDVNNPKILVEDLHKFYDQLAVKKHGRKLSLSNPKDYEIIKNENIQSIKNQLKKEVSGKGWYDEDVLKMFNMLSRMPGFEKLATSETHRVIYSAILGATSPGPKVAQNTKSGSAQYLKYLRTGKFDTQAPPAGSSVENIEMAGFGQYGYPEGLKMIQFLLDKFGEEKFADFMLSPITKKELTQLRLEAGFKGGPTGMSGDANSLHLGASILGDKAGKFMLNIQGYPTTTKDKWFVRTIRRSEGTFGDHLVKKVDKKKGTVKMVELGQPKNKSERLLMDQLVKDIVNDPQLKDLNLSEQDAQAILWFREQTLQNDLGVATKPETFSEGVEKVSGQEGFGILASDADKVAIESGTIEPKGYRGISSRQRAVRNNRRLQELNNSGSDGGQSGPYGTDGIPNDEGPGLLTFEPNPEVLANYNKAGLNIPIIKQVDAKTSANSYSTDMAEAMKDHPFGKQVTIQKPEDLLDAKLFRTEHGGGFAIKPDGDIVGVFQSPNAPPNSSYAMMQLAIQRGGKKLDAFATMLPKIYQTVGMKPVSRVKWSDEFAPEGWDKATYKEFNNGEPDLILFVYDPNYFGGADLNKLPIFDGPNGYDQAQVIQDKALKELGANDG
jgi:hypothetical protein